MTDVHFQQFGLLSLPQLVMFLSFSEQTLASITPSLPRVQRFHSRILLGKDSLEESKAQGHDLIAKQQGHCWQGCPTHCVSAAGTVSPPG